MNLDKINAYENYSKAQYNKALIFFKPYETETSWNYQKMASHSLTVSGSKIGAIAGHSAYKTALDVFLDMTLRKPPFTGNSKTRRGQAMEHETAYEAAEALHGKLGGGMELVYPDFKGFTCQIDETLKCDSLGLVLCECKLIAFPSKEWGKGSKIDADGNIIEEDSQIPHDYHDQVMWQLGITKAVYKDKAPDTAILSAIIKNEPKPRIFVIRFNEDEFNNLLKVAENFLFECVMKDTAPELTEEQQKALDEQANKKAKTVEGDFLQVENDRAKELFELSLKYADLNQQIKELTEQQGEIKGKLIEAIGAHEGITAYGTLIATYKTAKAKLKFNEKKFAESEPELYKKFCEEVAGTRIFNNKL